MFVILSCSDAPLSIVEVFCFSVFAAVILCINLEILIILFMWNILGLVLLGEDKLEYVICIYCEISLSDVFLCVVLWNISCCVGILASCSPS